MLLLQLLLLLLLLLKIQYFQMHPYTRMEDNTALNAIRLICSDDSEVGTAEGRLGTWTAEVRCQNDGDYITAVKIKTEEWLGWGADRNARYKNSYENDFSFFRGRRLGRD